MLIPIGHTGAIRRFPAVTIGIIVINTLAFMMTYKVIERTQARVMVNDKELLQYEVQLLKKYDRETYNKIEDDIKKLDIVSARKELRNFREQIKNGLVLNEDSREYERWKKLYAEYQSALDDAFLQKYGFVPRKFNLLGLFTSMYLHGGWIHLIGNMVFLWVVGGAIEDSWGIPFYLVFYHLGGIAATLTHYITDTDSIIPGLGASGAIFAVMGAFLVRHHKTKIKIVYWLIAFVGKFKIAAWIILPIWFVEQLIIGVTDKIGTGVAVWAHIGGFVFGFGFAVVVKFFNIEEKFLTPPQKEMQKGKVWKEEEIQEKETLDKNIEIGKELMAKGNYEDAIIAINSALHLNPNNLEALKVLYFAYLKLVDVENVTDAAGKMAEILIVQNRHSDSVEVYREIKKINPQAIFPVRIHYNLARAFYTQRLYPEAARAFYEFAVAYPDNPLASKAMFISAEILYLNLQDKQNAYKILVYLNQRYPNHVNKIKADEYIARITGQTPPTGNVPIQPR